MCYEFDLWLLTHDTEAKACDYETTETLSHKANRKPASRAERRKATAKAKRRHAETAELRKKHIFKAERDGEMWWFTDWNGTTKGIHDSKLWSTEKGRATTMEALDNSVREFRLTIWEEEYDNQWDYDESYSRCYSPISEDIFLAPDKETAEAIAQRELQKFPYRRRWGLFVEIEEV